MCVVSYKTLHNVVVLLLCAIKHYTMLCSVLQTLHNVVWSTTNTIQYCVVYYNVYTMLCGVYARMCICVCWTPGSSTQPAAAETAAVDSKSGPRPLARLRGPTVRAGAQVMFRFRSCTQ